LEIDSPRSAFWKNIRLVLPTLCSVLVARGADLPNENGSSCYLMPIVKIASGAGGTKVFGAIWTRLIIVPPPFVRDVKAQEKHTSSIIPIR